MKGVIVTKPSKWVLFTQVIHQYKYKTIQIVHMRDIACDIIDRHRKFLVLSLDLQKSSRFLPIWD